MFPEFNLQTPPVRLLDYVRDNEGLSYRQRAVCTKHSDNSWHLVCCVVQAFSKAIGQPEHQPSRTYDRALFFEHWHDAAQCLRLIDEAQSGILQFGRMVTIERGSAASWQSDILPSSNMYMKDAGLMARMRFESGQASLSVDALIDKTLPYYASAEEAAKEWLPFADYHGHGDGRNNDVLFLFPQFRAHFTSPVWSGATLKIGFGGADVGRDHTLLVKGNYWVGRSATHFERPVDGKWVSVNVARDVQRVEYYLTNARGTLFDSQDAKPLASSRQASSDEWPTSGAVPAADRLVPLDHNSVTYRETIKSIELVIVHVEMTNDFESGDDKQQSLAELNSGKSLLQGVRAHVRLVWSVIAPALRWLGEKFADGVVGGLATSALHFVRRLLGF